MDPLVFISWVILMSKQKLWYGFLEAGNKSSLVLIDHNMHTGEENKIFIYNHNRQEILKYSRDLVEPKLRELTNEEKAQQDSLKKGFTVALKTLKHPIAKPVSNHVKTPSRPKAVIPPEEPEVEIPDIGDDDWEDSND